jgi:hypothetical protein
VEKALKRKVIAGTVAATAIVGGGAAVAATQLTPQQESQAVVNDAAKQLGIQPSKLSAALKTALENRVDAAVAAGTITKAQGDAMKARNESGDVPLFGGGRDHGFGHGGGLRHHLDAAASYLGLSESALETALQAGKSLADVAKAQGKAVDGLVAALVADEKKELDAAVAAGRLTAAQEQTMLTNAQQRITDMVNGVRPSFRDGGPPPFAGPTA